jgi:hypothetical protein
MALGGTATDCNGMQSDKGWNFALGLHVNQHSRLELNQYFRMYGSVLTTDRGECGTTELCGQYGTSVSCLCMMQKPRGNCQNTVKRPTRSPVPPADWLHPGTGEFYTCDYCKQMELHKIFIMQTSYAMLIHFSVYKIQ